MFFGIMPKERKPPLARERGRVVMDQTVTAEGSMMTAAHLVRVMESVSLPFRDSVNVSSWKVITQPSVRGMARVAKSASSEF